MVQEDTYTANNNIDYAITIIIVNDQTIIIVNDQLVFDFVAATATSNISIIIHCE